jgi:hypothetical protein
MLPEPEEVPSGDRVVSRSQAEALRHSASSLERTAAALEEAELCDEADLVRRLSEELRQQSRHAAARLRGGIFMSSAPSRER